VLGDLVVAHVPVVAANALVAARAERFVAGAGEDDHADRGVVAGAVERVLQLEQRLRPERVAHFRPVDRDLGDGAVAVDIRVFVSNVAVLAGGGPRGARTDLRVGGHEPDRSQASTRLRNPSMPNRSNSAANSVIIP
jgi:hypothetical protein